MTLEPRCQIADWNPAEQRLTVYHSHQAPHMMQDLYARQFDLAESSVRVICKDVGGSFGVKVHAYPDDFATVALSILLKRPVKFVADRLESFTSDIHAREHRIRGRIAASKEGDILAFEIDDLTGIGPYSMFPRTSAIEGNQVVNLTGGPYRHQQYRANLKVVFLNKTPTCQYRGVGHPIACAVTEGLVDLAANKLGMDPLAFRKRNVIRDDAYPTAGASGIKLEVLSHEECLRKIETLMDYTALRSEQAALRERGIYRGIGFATLIELTNPGAAFYGVGGARIAAQDGATIRLEPTGAVTVLVSVGEQGQGAEGIFAQIAADAVGVGIDKVRVVTGDTDVTPYGGGTWASRGAGIGGEAVLQAGLALQQNLLKVAAVIMNRDGAGLAVRRDEIIDTSNGAALMPLSELGRVAYFRPDTLPPGFTPELMVTRHYAQRDYPFIFTNGVQASYVEVDIDTGFVKLLKHWAVEDCGRVINPMLVDEQIRGAVVQGIGGALYEECLYDMQRATAQRQHGRLPGADVRRDARHRRGACADADGELQARCQGRRRGRHGWSAGGGDERHQRRPAAPRRGGVLAALHARKDPEVAGSGCLADLDGSPAISVRAQRPAGRAQTIESTCWNQHSAACPLSLGFNVADGSISDARAIRRFTARCRR